MNIDVTAVFRVGAGYELSVAVSPGDHAITAHADSVGAIRERALEAVRCTLTGGAAELAVGSLKVQRPDVGPDGFIVRVISDAQDGVAADEAAQTAPERDLGRAAWWQAEGAWLVEQPGSGTSFVPSERLDFAPALEVSARKALDDALAEMDRNALLSRRRRGRTALDALLPKIAARLNDVAARHPGEALSVGLSYVLAAVLEPADVAAIAPDGAVMHIYPRTDVAIDDIAVDTRGKTPGAD